MIVEKVKVIPWNPRSVGAKALAIALGVTRLKCEGSVFKGSLDKKVINWGCSEVSDEILKSQIINAPVHVQTASNKLSFFNKMKGQCNIPEFTTDAKTALEWTKQGKTVLARTKLKSSSGAGIIFLEDNINAWVDAPLYTVYKKKKEEYRLHFAFGKLITTQQKVLRKEDDRGNPIDPTSVNFRIRNLANGFIFKRQNIQLPEDVIRQSHDAYVASGLHFGAVDVIYNATEGRAYVLEINTAPGLEGSTIDEYAQAFRENL